MFADDGRGPKVLVSPRPVIQIGDPFGRCGTGTVPDGQGGITDSLQIDGSPGNGRVVHVGYAQPFTVTLRVLIRELPEGYEKYDPLLVIEPPHLTIPWQEVPDGLESNEVSAWLGERIARPRQVYPGSDARDFEANAGARDYGVL